MGGYGEAAARESRPRHGDYPFHPQAKTKVRRDPKNAETLH